MNEFTDGKRLTSGFAYYSNAAIFICMSLIAAMACASFGYNRIGIEGGLIAGCITLAVIIFELRNNRKHSKLNSFVEWSLITIIVIFEVVVIGANFVAKTQHKETIQIFSEKAKIQTEIARLKNKLIKSPKSNTDKYDNRLVEGTITKEKIKLANLPVVIKSDEKEFYQLASEVLPFPAKIIELVFNIGLGGLLVLSCMMLGGRVNSYYCISQLKAHTKRHEEASQVIFDAANFKPVNKSGISTNLTTQGTQEGEPTVKKTITGNIEQAKEWVKSHKEGEKLSAKALRKATGTSSTSQQNVVISELRKAGLVSKKMNGKVPNYFKAEPKIAALEQIKETGNLINLFKK